MFKRYIYSHITCGVSREFIAMPTTFSKPLQLFDSLSLPETHLFLPKASFFFSCCNHIGLLWFHYYWSCTVLRIGTRWTILLPKRRTILVKCTSYKLRQFWSILRVQQPPPGSSSYKDLKWTWRVLHGKKVPMSSPYGMFVPCTMGFCLCGAHTFGATCTVVYHNHVFCLYTSYYALWL
jgi:hypothetical protein